ncbi:MAG: hypothetical protein KF810_09475 [Rhizobiaceae bacterium]|nr:hypothetical protein [Rhizobiaceae bacterium]
MDLADLNQIVATVLPHFGFNKRGLTIKIDIRVSFHRIRSSSPGTNGSLQGHLI